MKNKGRNLFLIQEIVSPFQVAFPVFRHIFVCRHLYSGLEKKKVFFLEVIFPNKVSIKLLFVFLFLALF